MDKLARLHLEYVILDVMKAPDSKIRAAADRYNKCLDGEFDRLEKSWPVVPEDFLRFKRVS